MPAWLDSIYARLAPEISIDLGTMPVRRWHTFQSSSGTLLVESGQHLHLTVSPETFFFSMMLG